MIQPILDRVLVKVIENPDITKGGIIIPSKAKEKPLKAIVIAVGPGRLREDGLRYVMSLQLNDHVVFSKYAGFDVAEDGVTYKMITEQDVLCTYLPEDAVEAPVNI